MECRATGPPSWHRATTTRVPSGGFSADQNSRVSALSTGTCSGAGNGLARTTDLAHIRNRWPPEQDDHAPSTRGPVAGRLRPWESPVEGGGLVSPAIVGPSGFEPESSGPEPPRIDQATPRTQDRPRKVGPRISVVRRRPIGRLILLTWIAEEWRLIRQMQPSDSMSACADSLFDTLIYRSLSRSRHAVSSP